MKDITWLKIGIWFLRRGFRKQGFVRKNEAGLCLAKLMYDGYRYMTKETPRQMLLMIIPEKGRRIDFFHVPRGVGAKRLAAMCWAGYENYTGHGGRIKVKK